MLQTAATIGGLELRDIAFNAVILQASFQRIEGLAVLENSVDHDNPLDFGFRGLGMAGDCGGADAGEKLEKSCGDHGD